MEKQVLFRAKRIDKDVFVEGDLIHGVGFKKGRIYILPLVENLGSLEGCHPLDGYEVHPWSIIMIAIDTHTPVTSEQIIEFPFRIR